MNRSSSSPTNVQGTADPRFAQVVEAFGKIWAGTRGGGALAVYQHGNLVVDIWAGTSDRAGTVPWAENTAALSYSTTKGVTSTVLHRLAERGLFDYDAPVAEYWPEFAANGKANITVAELMSHRAGLSYLRNIAHNVDEMLDYRLMEQRLAAAKPDRYRGVPAYHAITYGWLAAGLARAVTGKGMKELFRTEIAEPLGENGIHLGPPDPASGVQRAQFNGRSAALGVPFAMGFAPIVHAAPAWPATTFLRSIHTKGIERLQAGDDPMILHTEMPGANGVFTARSVAAMYSDLATGDGLLPPARLRAAMRIQTRKIDRNLLAPLAWRLGYHSFPTVGAPGAVGHIGFAGSGGWADHRSGVAVALVHNRLPEARFLAMDQFMLPRLSPQIMRAAARPAGDVRPLHLSETA